MEEYEALRLLDIKKEKEVQVLLERISSLEVLCAIPFKFVFCSTSVTEGCAAMSDGEHQPSHEG